MSKTSDNHEAAAFDLFNRQQGGVVPPTLAAHYLKISIQGVYNAGSRGRLDFVKWRGTRYYGWASLLEYMTWHSARVKLRRRQPREHFYDPETATLKLKTE